MACHGRIVFYFRFKRTYIYGRIVARIVVFYFLKFYGWPCDDRTSVSRGRSGAF